MAAFPFLKQFTRSSRSLRAWQIALLAAGWIIAADNRQFFRVLSDAFNGYDYGSLAILATLVCLQVALLLLVILVLGAGRLASAMAGVLLTVAALFGYFVDHAGVIFNTAMVNNIAATVIEGNASEATELSSLSLWAHVALFGLLPATMLSRVRIRLYEGWREPASRAAAILAAFSIALGMALPVSSELALFAADHREFRYYVTPLYPLSSLTEYVLDRFDDRPAFRDIGTDAKRAAAPSRRRLGIMVVGETARADRFSLGGYDRQTNPLLATVRGLQYFEASACGTSTAYSVPCMFFLRDWPSYDPAVAQSESNVLDVLSGAGIGTVWIDNNSSCKHVCDRIETVDLRRRPGQAILEDGRFDEATIPVVEGLIEQSSEDLLVVVHVLGSHGPAYARRYPSDFAVFGPACSESMPMNCSAEELSNAYDNSIVYTDYVLNGLIDLLQRKAAESDAFLLYVSDHGESLGEGGVYLHGLPRQLAPEEQLRVPVVFWRSWDDGETPLRTDASEWPGPDNLTHALVPSTLLGLFNITTGYYHRELDLNRQAGRLDGD